MNQDLSLVLLDDIWEELKKRYDGCVLATVKSKNNHSEERQLSYSGGKFVCIGLAEFARHQLVKSAELEEEK